MARLTLQQLERHLFAAADILHGKIDAVKHILMRSSSNRHVVQLTTCRR